LCKADIHFDDTNKHATQGSFKLAIGESTADLEGRSANGVINPEHWAAKLPVRPRLDGRSSQLDVFIPATPMKPS
jgi:hypothetical protein